MKSTAWSVSAYTAHIHASGPISSRAEQYGEGAESLTVTRRRSGAGRKPDGFWFWEAFKLRSNVRAASGIGRGLGICQEMPVIRRTICTPCACRLLKSEEARQVTELES